MQGYEAGLEEVQIVRRIGSASMFSPSGASLELMVGVQKGHIMFSGLYV